MAKSDLKPACVFEQFAKINEIPRPSKREEKMIDYLKNWGREPWFGDQGGQDR